MIGAIRRRDILTHPVVTIRCFGWRVFLSALFANRDQTFLSLLVRAGALQPYPSKAPDAVERCIKLELQAQRIYHRLAGRFLGTPPISDMFDVLAYQEQTHAELLQLCHEAAMRSSWKEACLAPWKDAVANLERLMAEAERSLDTIDDLSDALRLVIKIEGSEVNRVFASVMSACGSEFVGTLRVFQNAVTDHITYICQEIADLQPLMTAQCQELARAHKVPLPQANLSRSTA